MNLSWSVGALILIGACTSPDSGESLPELPEIEAEVVEGPSTDGAAAPSVVEVVPAAAVRAETPPPPARSRDRIRLEDIGIIAALGIREQDGSAGVLLKPLDAAFAGDRIAVLDASPPWVRIFDREGVLQSALAREGDGPGEARWPVSLTAGSDGRLILSHATGVEEFSASGELLRSTRGGYRFAGAVSACGDQLYPLLQGLTGPYTNSIARRRDDGDLLPLATIEGIRQNSRKYHPWFVEESPTGLLMYTEEQQNSRLVDFGCDGEIRREIPLSPLGEGENTRRTVLPGTNQSVIGIRSPQPPHPAGLARIGDVLLWATRELTGDPERPDTVTVIRVASPTGRTESVAITGWFQIFDHADDGLLLVSNTWTRMQNWVDPGTWGLIPTVFVVDGKALVEMIEARGN